MAEHDGGEKTDAPTPRRRQEAREQGQVPRSQDLTAAIILLTGLTLLSSFYVQFGSVVFLILGGHRLIFSVILDTFEHLPLLAAIQGLDNALPLLLQAMTTGVDIAVRVAAPVVLTLFLVNIALGFVGRTVPQLNILTLGFPIKGILGLVLLAVTLPSALTTFNVALASTVRWIDQLMMKGWS